MKKLLNSIASRVSDVASSKVTKTAATAVVDKVGPHTALKKVGTILALVGIVLTLVGWFLLSSWPSTISLAIGIAFIALGIAMRYVNSLLVSLLVKLFQSLLKRLTDFGQRTFQRLRNRSPGGNEKTNESNPEN